MIGILREYNDLIILFFTIAVGISTIVYAYLTAKLVNETKKMRKSQTDPEISLSLVQHESSITFIELVVDNIGFGPAYNVKFEVIKDFKVVKRNLSEVGFVKNGIAYFSPKQPMKLWVASFREDNDLENKSIEINVSFENSIAERFERKFILSFSQFANFLQLGTPPLHKIARKLESMERDIHNIATGFNKLKVHTFDSNDREEEQRQLENHINEIKEKQKNKNSTQSPK